LIEKRPKVISVKTKEMESRVTVHERGGGGAEPEPVRSAQGTAPPHTRRQLALTSHFVTQVQAWVQVRYRTTDTRRHTGRNA
jgi:hypothetical protein